MHYKITALFPFDPGSASNVLNIIAKKRVDEKEFKEKDVEETLHEDLVDDKIFGLASEDWEEIDVDATLNEEMLRFSLSIKLTPLNLPMTIKSLLTTQFLSMNNKTDIKMNENCVNDKEIDASEDEVSAVTWRTERFP